jgi:hypothetical protein
MLLCHRAHEVLDSRLLLIQPGAERLYGGAYLAPVATATHGAAPALAGRFGFGRRAQLARSRLLGGARLLRAGCLPRATVWHTRCTCQSCVDAAAHCDAVSSAATVVGRQEQLRTFISGICAAACHWQRLHARYRLLPMSSFPLGRAERRSVFSSSSSSSSSEAPTNHGTVDPPALDFSHAPRPCRAPSHVRTPHPPASPPPLMNGVSFGMRGRAVHSPAQRQQRVGQPACSVSACSEPPPASAVSCGGTRPSGLGAWATRTGAEDE